ncbi:MAG: SDR family oxidoreductase [Candidatus Kapabacteria bacterium]|nr:SDR family oxidoreductase [Candidatus Kapabacteria bacterium]MCS7169852.1 SDR family oxidoreductase [Candidatus Kapabacteria bacterium]MDW7996130.1 SDR family oxidoreductase [Bacteroidota bacterium]MDW8225518.1 SDR family oxidoreductase [Bacteroidota bacterium]
MAQQVLYALILGASSGFGRAAALALAKEGYHIVGVHLDRAATLPKVEELKAELSSYGVRTMFFNQNAADSQCRQTVVTALQKEFSAHPGATVRVLLHSLAFGTLLPFIAEPPQEVVTQKRLEMTLDVMANSLVYWTQDLVRERLIQQGGRILAMTSAGSERVIPMYGAVSAAKAALESYVRQLALELAPYGITANAIRAGVTDTPALRRIPGNDILIDNAIARNPYHRLTTPDDVARIVALLVRPEAGWINGAIIAADGGENIVDITWWKPQSAESL